MFHFLHLQENLVYITCKDAISPDLIYYIMKGYSVFIRNIYQLDSNTLLVDLNVPTGELDYNLTSTLIKVCNKYFYTYHNDKFILEAYLANSYLEDPRIIQDYSFILSCGRLYARRKSIVWLSTFVQLLLSCTYGKLVLYTSTTIRWKQIELMVSYVCIYSNINQLEWQIYFELRTKTGLSVWFLVKTIGSS